MDPRERADAALARARARGAFVVTPDDAVSPMDAANTVQIPRAVVNAADDQQDNTMVISTGVARGQVPPGYGPPRGHQTGPHQPVPYPGNQPHQPGPYPGNQYQSGQHQPVPPPAPQQNQPRPSLFEEQEPTPRQLDGLVPTTHHPGTQRGTLSRRLDGQ
jgi:hypothetical protein